MQTSARKNVTRYYQNPPIGLLSIGFFIWCSRVVSAPCTSIYARVNFSSRLQDYLYTNNLRITLIYTPSLIYDVYVAGNGTMFQGKNREKRESHVRATRNPLWFPPMPEIIGEPFRRRCLWSAFPQIILIRARCHMTCEPFYMAMEMPCLLKNSREQSRTKSRLFRSRDLFDTRISVFSWYYPAAGIFLLKNHSCLSMKVPLPDY